MGININVGTALAPPAGDQANAVEIGNFTTTASSGWFPPYGDFNVAIWGTFSGTIVAEKTYDGGTTAIPVVYNGGTVAVSYTAPMTQSFYEPEPGAFWRLRCSVYASGTIDYRLSAGGLMARSQGWR